MTENRDNGVSNVRPVFWLTGGVENGSEDSRSSKVVEYEWNHVSQLFEYIVARMTW